MSEDTVTVTFFPDQKALTCRRKDLTLEQLRQHIATTTATDKLKLPWLKLASFGTVRSKKKCLRTIANMLQIFGVEGDYDAEVTSFDDAVAIIKRARLRALLYTSASYTTAKQRWRVLCFTSQPLPPADRNRLIARLNGVFDGTLGNESWPLNQSFLYGSVNNNPEHRVAVVDGDFIDQRPDLDAGARGKSLGKKGEAGKAVAVRGFASHLAMLGDGDGGDGFNGPLCSATSAYAARHGKDFDRDALKATLRAAIKQAPKKADRKPSDIERYLSDAYLDDIIGSAADKFGREFPDLTKSGGTAATLLNTKIAITKLGIDCRYDLFKMRHIINGHAVDTFVGAVSDPALRRLRETIRDRFEFDPATATVHDAVLTLAEHRCFHPVRDYLDSLVWDGVPRLDTWLITYGGAEDADYTRAVGALVLIAAVHRVRQPGCKFDEIMVLENEEQGTNKSSALAVLAKKPEWFSDNLPLGLSAKETIEALSGFWIVEASELHGMRGAATEKVKAFASRQWDRARMSYDRTVSEVPRQCVIIGTTNNPKYLQDPTGNRRFWPVRVARFDLSALRRDVDQLWAEATAREADSASIRMPETLWKAAAIEQQDRVVENPFVSVLDSVLRWKSDMKNGEWVDGEPMEGKITVEDVWTALKVLPNQRRQQQFEWLGEAMKQLGWERAYLRVGKGQRLYHYIRGPQPHKRIVVVLIEGVPLACEEGKEPVSDTTPER